jgi:hypothetical protein
VVIDDFEPGISAFSFQLWSKPRILNRRQSKTWQRPGEKGFPPFSSVLSAIGFATADFLLFKWLGGRRKKLTAEN